MTKSGKIYTGKIVDNTTVKNLNKIFGDGVNLLRGIVNIQEIHGGVCSSQLTSILCSQIESVKIELVSY
jgi:hypothetical protein